jgi:hypothetical protein
VLNYQQFGLEGGEQTALLVLGFMIFSGSGVRLVKIRYPGSCYVGWE